MEAYRNANLGCFTLDRMMRIVAALDDRLRVTVLVEPRPALQPDIHVSG